MINLRQTETDNDKQDSRAVDLDLFYLMAHLTPNFFFWHTLIPQNIYRSNMGENLSDLSNLSHISLLFASRVLYQRRAGCSQ